MIEVRCALCGKKSGLASEDKDYKRIIESPKKVIWVCEMCNNRVRFESEDKMKPKKPI